MQIDPLIQRVPYTPDLFSLASSINQAVNAGTTYRTDLDKYGVDEKWENADLEGYEGDCEDIVIAKEKRLRAAGVPLAALDTMTCWDETGAYHCVLILRTDMGDYVLDNRQFAPWAMEANPWGYRLEKTTVGGTFTNWRMVA